MPPVNHEKLRKMYKYNSRKLENADRDLKISEREGYKLSRERHMIDTHIAFCYMSMTNCFDTAKDEHIQVATKLSGRDKASNLLGQHTVVRRVPFNTHSEVYKMYPKLAKEVRTRRISSNRDHILMYEYIIDFLIAKYDAAETKEDLVRVDAEEAALLGDVFHHAMLAMELNPERRNLYKHEETYGSLNEKFWKKLNESHIKAFEEDLVAEMDNRGFIDLVEARGQRVDWRTNLFHANRRNYV